MAEVLMEFPQLTMSLPDGREESIMQRTCLVSTAIQQLSMLQIMSTDCFNVHLSWLCLEQGLQAATVLEIKQTATF